MQGKTNKSSYQVMDLATYNGNMQTEVPLAQRLPACHKLGPDQYVGRVLRRWVPLKC